MKGNTLSTPLRGRDAKLRKRPNEFGDKGSPSTKCQWPSQRSDERVEVTELLFLRMGKYPWIRMSDSWPGAWRCGKETGILPHYYFPWKDLEILLQERRWRHVMVHFNMILFHKSGSANKQYAYQSLSIYKWIEKADRKSVWSPLCWIRELGIKSWQLFFPSHLNDDATK